MNTEWLCVQTTQTQNGKRKYIVRQMNTSGTTKVCIKQSPSRHEWTRQPDQTERMRDGIVDRRNACILAIFVVIVLSIVYSLTGAI